jgi:tetratricopeptide (TPR) repeat protein
LADIFLSYVRADAAIARALAALLEKAGHSVWWDRHIKGGAQFAQEIETALKAADKVVVLWSGASVGSPWVRDEAAAGRDTGRLVPVSLDGVQAPLGFGQYQTINFSNWRGRGRPAAFGSLLEAVASSGNTALVAAAPAPSRSRRIPSRLVLWLAPAVVGIAVVGTYLAFQSPGSDAASVIVEPASADGVAIAAARDLSISLASVEATSAGLFQLSAAGPNETKSADLLFQVGGENGPTSSTRDLTVLNGPTRTILWAGHFEQPSTKAAHLSAQVSVTAARVLSCAVEALSEGKTKLNEQTIKLYLSGCSRLAEEYDETTSDVATLFEKVVQRAPRFAPAWARLLYSEAIAVDGLPDSPMLAPLRKHFDAARRHNIQTGATYIAQAALLPSNRYFERIEALERGLAAHPGDAMLEATLADWLMRVGRQNDAIDHARRASELDPASPAARMRYVWTLAHSGKPGALNELKNAERSWPGAKNIELARFSYEMRYGDPRVALRMVEEGSSRWGEEAVIAFLHARLNPTKANIDRAVAAQAQMHRQIPPYVSGLVVTLATFGRNKEAIDALLAYKHPEAAGFNSEGWFRSATRGMRRDPRFIQAMAQVGLLNYWKRSGKWPDFCFDPELPYDCKTEAAKYRA